MKKGMALITILIIVLFLFSLVGAFLFLITNARRLNERYHENLAALALAEAGVDYAIWEINFGGGDFLVAEGWSGVNPKTTTISNFQDTDGNIYGDISIWVYNPGTDDVVIISEGSMSSITGPAVIRKIRVTLEPHKLFNYAILTTENITMTGNAATDSYDSSQGSYGGSNKYENGDIVTNGSGDPAIALSGNAKVKGDANTGEGGTIQKTGNAEITGAESDMADEPMPPVDVPDALEGLFSLGPLLISGNNSLTLFGGDYRYDSIQLSGNSILTLSGALNFYITGNINTSGNSRIIMEDGSNVKLYFDGDLSISGNGVWNKTEDPSEFSLFGTETSSQVSLSGNSNFHGTIYAPSADVTVTGNGALYGAVAGDKVNLAGNAKIHYDEQLADDGATIGYDPSAWQEK